MKEKIQSFKNLLIAIMLLSIFFFFILTLLSNVSNASNSSLSPRASAYFLSIKLDMDMLEKISVPEQESLFKQAKANDFNKKQVEQYINGLVNHPPQDSRKKQFYDEKNLISAPYYYKHRSYYQADDRPVNSYKIKTFSQDQTGVYWVVKGKTGFVETSAWIELPEIININAADRPYMFFAAHTTNAKLIGDYGLVYIPAEKAWQGFTNVQRWNGTGYSVIDQTYGEFIPSSVNKLYMHIGYNSGQMRVRILDGEDFEKVYFDEIVSTHNLIDSNGSNLQFYREITMAQHLSTPFLNISTGSSYKNATFKDCYLYTGEGFLSWSPHETAEVYIQTPFPYQLATVTLEKYQPWKEERVSIVFPQQ